MLKCSSCQKEVTNNYVRFKCPSCAKSTIFRCDNCRSNVIAYICPECGFKGP